MAARARKIHIGMMLEIAQVASLRQPQKVWLPFMVTHMYDGDVVSGVALSGEPGPLGWMNRAAQAFDHVEKGDEPRMWRFAAEAPNDPEPTPKRTRTRTPKTN